MKFYNRRYKKFLKASSLVDLLKIQEVTVAGREVGYLTKAEARRQAVAKRKHAKAISKGLKKAHREKRRTRALLADLAKGPTPEYVKARQRPGVKGFLGVPAGGLPADVKTLCALDFVAWRTSSELMEETGLTQSHVVMTRKRLKKAKLIEERRRRGWRDVRRDEPRFMLRLTEAGLRYCAALAVLIGDRPRSIEGVESAEVDSEIRERIAARLAARRSAGAVRMWADPEREGAARQIAALTDPEVRARAREGTLRLWNDPEYVKRHAEWSRRTYKERKEEADRCLAIGRNHPKRIAATRVAMRARWQKWRDQRVRE